jgi:hypothetical protein
VLLLAHLYAFDPLHVPTLSIALPQAHAMVDGFTNPLHKSFKTRQEAEKFLAQHSSGSSSGKAYGTVRGPDGEAAGEQQQQLVAVGETERLHNA